MKSKIDLDSLKEAIKAYIEFCQKQAPELMWIKDIPEGIDYEEYLMQKQEEFIDNFINYYHGK